MSKAQSILIVAAICARGGSKGVPGKNLRALAGKPLIAHSIECAMACSALNQIVVSTDDEAICRIASKYGARVPFLRPPQLAQDDSSKWHVFQHLVQSIEEMDGVRIDVLVDLDTGVPLRKPEDITACVQKLETRKADVVVTAYEADRNPYFNMVEIDDSGLARISKPSSHPILNRQAAPQVYSLSPAVYAIRRDALWELEHWSAAKLQVHVIPRERAVDIDSEMDFRFVEYLIQAAGNHN